MYRQELGFSFQKPMLSESLTDPLVYLATSGNSLCFFDTKCCPVIGGRATFGLEARSTVFLRTITSRVDLFGGILMPFSRMRKMLPQMLFLDRPRAAAIFDVV
jgi:hypothetical protein